MPLERAITYIDGYNLYFGLRASGLATSRWLDLGALSQSLLKPKQHLETVRYFTTRVRNDQAAAARQATYLDALEAQGGIDIAYGHFLSKTVTCFSCQHTWHTHEEKKTDVNIAVRLLEDAYDDLYDLALVISGDSDLAPPSQQCGNVSPTSESSLPFHPRDTPRSCEFRLTRRLRSRTRRSDRRDYRLR